MTNNQLTDERIEKIAVWLATESHSLNLEMLTCLRELQERRKVNADLTMWVKRLGYSLKRAKPDSKLPGDAMTYLSAKGLISVEDILR
ncbi:TPA: hypothetical protein MEI10_002971 [Klebsiella quasipneumoniae subsp. similipneumoniae]|uniref:hypothetical protein n=1 Tax=Klebsiella quasipneumoniae TaxID=1463165 RepID=UPI00388E8825